MAWRDFLLKNRLLFRPIVGQIRPPSWMFVRPLNSAFSSRVTSEVTKSALYSFSRVKPEGIVSQAILTPSASSQFSTSNDGGKCMFVALSID